jgi:hypothetical protein
MNTTTTKTEILAGNSPNFSLTINGAFSLSAAVGAYSKGLIAIARTASNSCYARVNATTFNSVSSSQADLTFYDTANSKMLIGGSRRSDGTVFSAAGTKIGCSCILNTGIPVADMISIENAINALMVALGRN